jgi:hypothetical protein
MTRQEAEKLVAGLGKTYGVQAELSPGGFGGLSVDMASLFFEFSDAAQALECSALVYKFRDPPKPGIIEGFAAEAAAGTDTGGGQVDYEPQNKGLFLSRTYQMSPEPTKFEGEMKTLMKASLAWGEQVLPRVSERVFHAK